MEAIVDEKVDRQELKKFENVYNQQVSRGKPSEKAQFEYAWCLIRSEFNDDVRIGLSLLQELFTQTNDEHARRDYLFYMSIGCCKTKEYPTASKYAKAILQVEPRNRQALDLQQYIEKALRKDGLMGMAIVGGAAIAIGGIIGLAFGVAKKASK